MSAVLDLHPDPGHPAAVISGVREALDACGSVAGVLPGEYAGLVAECARARTRLQSLELKLVAAADRAAIAKTSGSRSTGAWLATQTRSDQA